MRTILTLPLTLLLLIGTGCTPYGVHTTARPLAKGERSMSGMLTVVPAGAKISDSSSLAMPSIDVEGRVGLDDRSDMGWRVNSMSGAILTYKRRLDGPSARDAAATAIMVGGGLVNWGQHAHLEATLMTSGRDGTRVVPYGGVRVIQVAPLSAIAPHDSPTIGAFGGARIGSRQAGITLEIGVFHDRSALGLRRGSVIVVPSISMQSATLSRLLGQE